MLGKSDCASNAKGVVLGQRSVQHNGLSTIPTGRLDDAVDVQPALASRFVIKRMEGG